MQLDLPKLRFLPTVHSRQRRIVGQYDWMIPVFSAKGWLSVNYWLGCNIGCAYCSGSTLRTRVFERTSFGGTRGVPVRTKKTVQLFGEKAVAEHVLQHPFFLPARQAGQFGIPLGLHTGTTEAFVPRVKGSTFRLLKRLDKAGIKNDVIILTKLFLEPDEINRLQDTLENIRLKLMVCYSALPQELEPVNTKRIIRGKRLMLEHGAKTSHSNVQIFHYLRPLAIGWNTSLAIYDNLLRFGETGTAVVIGGISLDGLTAQVKQFGLPLPLAPEGGWEGYGIGRKYLPRQVIEQILERRDKLGVKTPLVRRASCAVSLANAWPDYNAHRIDDPEKNCLSSCSQAQQDRCDNAVAPTEADVRLALTKIGCPTMDFALTDKAIVLENAPAFTNLDAFSLRHLLRWPVKLRHGQRIGLK